MYATIYGYRYELDQSFTVDDKKSLLKNEESDVLFEYELSAEISPVEAIHELFLRHNGVFHLKPSDVSSEEFVNQLKVIYDQGFENGKRNCAEYWINEMQGYVSNLIDEE